MRHTLRLATEEPEAEKDYYFRLDYQNTVYTRPQHRLYQDRSCQGHVTIDGFTVEYLRAETNVFAGCDEVRLFFKATKNAPYVLKGVTANGSGYEYDDNTGIYWPDYGSTRAAVWADAAPPSTAYYIFHSRFHTDKAKHNL
jgi:hypothetical protein